MENRPDIAENHGKMGENKDVANTVQVCDLNSKMLQKIMQMRDFLSKMQQQKHANERFWIAKCSKWHAILAPKCNT